MVNGAVLVVIIIGITSGQFVDKQIEYLVKQWAPLIWLSPQENHMPLSVEEFLKQVHIEEENRKSIEILNNEFPKSNSIKMYLVTNQPVEVLKEDRTSFIYGKNPSEHSIPVYVTVRRCTAHISFRSSSPTNLKNDIDIIYGKAEPNLYLHISYWFFYPYNEGKEVCFLGKVPTPKIFNTCFGYTKLMGNHVGDWEHMSLSFVGKPVPNKIYVSVHDAGAYYKYDILRRFFRYDSQNTRKGIVQNPKFPPIVRMQGGHPVLFSAHGSHGLWSSPGEHEFVRMPRLSDVNGYGIPWKTWNNVTIYYLGKSALPDWVNFTGRWGNPQSNCVLLKKLGLCEITDGPQGILREKQDFYCG